MTCDIFIRSYDKDFEWLSYCLRSIQRFATGFRSIVVVTPHGQVPPTGTAEVCYQVAEIGDQYLQQQSDKLHADHFTDAEFILFMDSDTIFTRPICPDDVIVDNRKPRWLMTPYSSLSGDDVMVWKTVTEKVIGHWVYFEFMRRHPLVVPRWALREFREWVHKVHGYTLERYIMNQPDRHFSEWNAIGAWLWHYHPSRIHWMNTETDPGTCFVHQSYSYGGLNPDLRQHLESALA